MEPLTTSMKFRIGFAIIGILVGLSIGFVFGIVYQNIDTAIWGAISGLFAGVTLVLHLKQVKDKWTRGSTLLRPLIILGVIGQAASVCAAIVYLIVAIVERQGLTPSGRGYYLSCVWALMTWKWAFLLFICARIYRRQYEQRTGTSADVGYVKI